MTRHLRFKRLVSIASVAMAAAVVAACSSGGTSATKPQNSSGAAAGAHGEVSFWSWAPGLDKDVALFNKVQSKIHVTLSVPPAGAAAYAKMASAIKAGNGPDLAHVEFTELPVFQTQGYLTDLGKLGADQYQKDYVPWTWAQGVLGGHTVAIPWASGALGLYYRADLFRKYGIAAPPATWAQFAEDAAKVHTANPKAYMSFFGADESSAQWWMAYPWQAGARWFGTSADSWTVNMAEGPTLGVAKYWQDLLDKKELLISATFSAQWFKALQDGSLLTLPAPQWMSALLKGNAPKLAGDWRVAPLPEWQSGTVASANYGGSSLAVLKGAKNPQAALVFAHWMTTDPAAVNIWLTAGDGWPAATDLSKLSGLKTPDPYYGGQSINDVFGQMDAAVNKNWQWTPATDETFSAFSQELNKVVQGQETIGDALQNAGNATKKALTSKGISVK